MRRDQQIESALRVTHILLSFARSRGTGAIDLTEIDEKRRTKKRLKCVLRIPWVTRALPQSTNFPQSKNPLAFLLILSRIVSVNHVM